MFARTALSFLILSFFLFSLSLSLSLSFFLSFFLSFTPSLSLSYQSSYTFQDHATAFLGACLATMDGEANTKTGGRGGGGGGGGKPDTLARTPKWFCQA